MTKENKQSRGIRNNNPGNIDYNDSVKWQGLDDPATDGRFCRFKSATYGIRALARVLITYQDKYSINSVAGAIRRWAPPNENNTQAYISHVCDYMMVKPEEKLDFHDYSVLRPLVISIIRHENGVMPYSDAEIDKGLALAGVEPPAKPLSKSRTIRGQQVAAAGTVVSALAPVMEQVDAVKGALDPLEEYLPWVKFAVIALTIAGIAYTVWARIDDQRRLAR